MKKILNLLVGGIFVALSSHAQSQNYVLQAAVNHFHKSSAPSFLVASADRKFLIKEITSPAFQFDLDSIVSYPQRIIIDYYQDCNPEEIKQLRDNGLAKKRPQARTLFFMVDSINTIAVQKDTIVLLKPGLLQKRYWQMNRDIDKRIDSFNQRIGGRLFSEFKASKIQREKDSLERLKDNIFKANVGKPNLDSVLMPTIQNNIANPLSLEAMKLYIYQTRAFQWDIPASIFQSYLDAMPQQQKQYARWHELDDIVRSVGPNTSLVGKEAPELMDLKDSLGHPVFLKDFKGKVVFMDFWASWCSPCMAQLPQLKQIYDEQKDKDLDFVGVSLDVNSKDWKQAIKQSDLPWTNITDLKITNGRTVVRYNVMTIPHNFLIDKHGVVVGDNIPLDSLPAAIRRVL